MRNLLLFALCVAPVCAQSDAAPAPRAPRPAAQTPAIVSPEIASDRRVTFRLLAPKATEVSLTGEFLTGSTSLQKDDKGTWSVAVGPLDPEIYNYNFVIDGVRTIDPNNASVKTGSTPGTISSILNVSSGAP